MNIVEIIAQNKYPIKSFDTKICNCFVSVGYNKGKIILNIKGRKSDEKIKNLALEILSMFFLYQGFYPTIERIKCNGIEHNSNLAGKFFTSSQFKKIAHGLIEINEKTICDEVYKKFETLRGNYLYSFEYLFSTDYEKIVTNHKIMLLLHCLEGCIANSKYDQMRTTVPKKIDGRFGKRIYLVLNTLFHYDRKFNADLLKLLKVSKYGAIKILSDTRNENSHYIAHDLALQDGGYMIYYFYILYYTFRIFIVEALDLKIDEDKAKNYFYEIHDWLNDNLYKGKYAYKSSIYQLNEQLKKHKMDKG